MLAFQCLSKKMRAIEGGSRLPQDEKEEMELIGTFWGGFQEC